MWAEWLVLSAVLASSGSRPVHYTVGVDPEHMTFHVTMRLDAHAGPLRVAMPASTPGEVSIKNHARHVGRLEARDTLGHLLTTRRVDKQTWEAVVPAPQVVAIDYDVHVNEGDRLRLGTNWLTDGGGFIEGATLFLYSPGRLNEPVAVDLELPPSWRVATPLKPSRGGFGAADYRHLLDAPIQFGRFSERTVTAGRLRCRVVFDVPLPAHDEHAFDANLSRILETETALFGSAPFEQYLVLVHWRPDLEFGGGLEHGDAMVLNVGKEWMEDLPVNAAGTLAHEMFHAWNAEAFYPRELKPWSYSSDNYSRQLWFVEGVTSYYAHLVLVRSGIRSKEAFLNSLSLQVSAFEGEPERGFESLSDAGVEAWAQPVGGLDYYAGGEVAGLLLDLEIRLATNGRRSLDDVMRALYRQSRQPGYGGYGRRELVRAVSDVAQRDFRPFFAQYVDGRGPIDYAVVLGRAGLQATSNVDEKGRRCYSISVKEGLTQAQAGILEGLMAVVPGNLQG